MSELSTVNPFSDPDFKRKILKKEGLSTGNSSEGTHDYEILEPIDNTTDSGTILNPVDIINNNKSRIPKDVDTIIYDASSITARDKVAKTKEISNSLSTIFTDFNEKYGLDLKVDFNSAARTIVNLRDEKSLRTLELYISRTFRGVKSYIYLRMLQSLCVLADDIMDTKKLISDDSATFSEKYLIFEKIVQIMTQVEAMKDSININGDETELKRISEQSEKTGSDKALLDEKNVSDFMKQMLSENGIDE